MNKIRTLIIDDEQLARDIVRSYLVAEKDFEIVGECSNGFDGFKQIEALQPDLVFLDVMMPKLTGFEMLELVVNPPEIIFSTAYDEYAIKAFEQNAVDYLLKPYSKERFLEALLKARIRLESQESNEKITQLLNNYQGSTELLNRVAVKTGSKIHIISIDKIRYLEAQDDYVKLYTEEGNFLKQNTMKYYEAHLPGDDFVRIHRSYITRVKEIARIEPMGKDTHIAVLHHKDQLPVSKSGYNKLRAVLGF